MSDLLDHIQSNMDVIEDFDDSVFEMSNLYSDDTGIENWIVFISSKRGRKRPRVKLAQRGKDLRMYSRSTIIYIDTVEIDPKKDHSGAPAKIKKRVLAFLNDKYNNYALLRFWNEPDMARTESNKMLDKLVKY